MSFSMIFLLDFIRFVSYTYTYTYVFYEFLCMHVLLWYCIDVGNLLYSNYNMGYS